MLSEKGHGAPGGDVLLAGWPSRDLHNLPVAVSWHMPATTKTLPSQFFQLVKPEREWWNRFCLLLQGTPPGMRGKKGENVVIRCENVTYRHYGVAP